MRLFWRPAALAVVAIVGCVALSATQIVRGVEYTPVTISQLEEINTDGSSHWADLHPTSTLYPVQFAGVVINKPSDMLNYTYDASSNPSPKFQVYVQALSSGGTYGGYTITPGDSQGTAVYMMKNNWGPSSGYYTEQEWSDEMSRIGASSLNVGDVVLIQAKAPGMAYNGKYNINEQHKKSSDYDFSISVLGHTTPIATPIALTDVKDTNNNPIFDSSRATGCERYQGSLVHLDNLMLVSAANWGLNQTVTVRQGDRTFDMLLGLDSDLLSVGASSLTTRPFDITAIFDQESADYQAGYRLWLTDSTNLTPALLGDANLDNIVDDTDLNAVINHFGMTGQTWYTADFTGDGIVDDNDLNTVINHYGESRIADGASSATCVPEPSSLALLATLATVGCGWTLRRRVGRSLMKNLSALTLTSRRPAMKRFLILGVAVLLSGMATANAEVLTISSTRTAFNSSLDEIDIHLTGFDTSISTDTKLNLLNGTWMATANSGTPGIYLGGTSFNWKGLTSNNNYAGQTPPQSYVNFNLTNDNATWSRTSIGDSLYSSFQGALFTTNSDAKLRIVDPDLTDGFDQTLIAKMYVSTGAGISFTGNIGLSNRDPIYVGGFSVQPVPEPGTIVLLAVGALAGLVFWKWRSMK